MVSKWQATHWWQWRRRLYMVTVKVSWERNLWVSRVLHGKWSWNGHSSVTLVKRVCIIIVPISWEIELSESLELSFRDGLEIAGHMAMILEGNCTISFNLYHGHQMYVCAAWQSTCTKGQWCDCTRKWSWRKLYMFHIMIMKSSFVFNLKISYLPFRGQP